MTQTIDGEVVVSETNEDVIEALKARVAELEAERNGVTQAVQTSIERSLHETANGAGRPSGAGDVKDAPTPLELDIDINKMEVGDLELFGMDLNRMPGSQIVDFLERVIITPDFNVRRWPMSRLEELMDAVSTAIEQAGNPKN